MVFGFQSLDAVLAALAEPVQLTFYVTPNTLPEPLLAAGAETIATVATEIAADSGGKFIYEMVNLDDPNSPVTPAVLQDTYGFQPIPTSFFSTDTYYAHMVLQNGEELQLLYPPTDVTEAEIRNYHRISFETHVHWLPEGRRASGRRPIRRRKISSLAVRHQRLVNYGSLREQTAAGIHRSRHRPVHRASTARRGCAHGHRPAKPDRQRVVRY